MYIVAITHFILLLGGVLYVAKCSNEIKSSIITFKCSITEMKIRGGIIIVKMVVTPVANLMTLTTNAVNLTTICHKSHYKVVRVTALN